MRSSALCQHGARRDARKGRADYGECNQNIDAYDRTRRRGTDRHGFDCGSVPTREPRSFYAGRHGLGDAGVQQTSEPAVILWLAPHAGTRSATERAKGVFSAAASSTSDATSSAAGTTREQFGNVSDQARQGTRVATDRFNTTLQENPMALGVAALAAGAIFGLTLPATRVEGEYMGEDRDRLVDHARSLAQESAGKVQRATVWKKRLKRKASRLSHPHKWTVRQRVRVR
jgi:hypothetical protein